MKKFANRMNIIGTESAFEVLAKVKELERQGKKISRFEIGEPDFDTPENIREAAKRALDAGATHYTPAAGMWEARQAVAEYVSRTRKIDVKPEEVIITPGGKPGLFAAIFAFVEKGDEVIMPNPAYPTYESAVNTMGGKSVFVPLLEENDFNMTTEQVEEKVSKKTKMIVLNSPHNPCGSSLDKKNVEGIAEIARRHDLLVLSDEIYSRITYEKPHYSIASEDGMKERTIISDGWSKTYAMTGWRLGYAVAPIPIIEKMARIALNIYSCPATFVQLAGIEALQGPQNAVDEMVREYKKRRALIHRELSSMKGVKCKLPGGAFYIFPNVKSFGMPARELMEKLLYEGGVSSLHGTAFGKYGEGYLRFSYATSLENIKAGMRKVKAFFEKL